MILPHLKLYQYKLNHWLKNKELNSYKKIKFSSLKTSYNN